MATRRNQVSKLEELVDHEQNGPSNSEADLVPFYRDPLAPIIFGGIAAAAAAWVVCANYLAR